MDNKTIQNDLKTSGGDIAHTSVKAIFSTIPYIGGPVAELFEILIAPPLAKRRDKWLLYLYEGLNQLKERIDNLKIEELANNESFITILLNATRTAIYTHREEKLEALRNLTLNTIVSNKSEEDSSLIFLRILDTLTVSEIAIFKTIYQTEFTNTKIEIWDLYIPLKENGWDYSLIDYAINSLTSNGLLDITVNPEVELIEPEPEYSSKYDVRTHTSSIYNKTQIGNSFFSYIAPPNLNELMNTSE